MNMNFKRILSSALVIIMMFSVVAVMLPVEVKAAHHSSVSDTKLSTDDVVKIVEAYKKAAFKSAEEMFQSDLANGYLDYTTNGQFTIYVNRYTGVLYYRNNTTGEMLTSNSYNFENSIGAVPELASQVYVSYATLSSTEKVMDLYSFDWAAMYNQISVSRIEGGLRVSYAIGDTATRCLLPVIIEAHTLEEDILKPMFELLYAKMIENLDQDPNKSYAINYYDESGKYYVAEKVYKENYIHQKSIRSYTRDFENIIAEYEQYLIDNAKVTGGLTIANIAKINEVEAIMGAINTVFNAYQPYNNVTAENFDVNNTPEICLEGVAVYKVKDNRYSQMVPKANYIKNYCPAYTFDMMYEAEKNCGYVHEYESKPVFRCALEYTFNEDGSLSVRLPSNSIVFDETEYILRSITPLQYFGATDFSNDGYIFLPDGSGSIIQFEDFRGSNISMSSALSIYGNDFCYSEISGAHKQPLTMPVYGIAALKDQDGNKVGKGYFAILEEGASMASMNVRYRSGTFREGTVFTTFTPYPTDRFDLSETISVGGAQFYSKVSESKYSGSYVTRYVMLTDNGTTGSYPANYMGMATYYRDYLEKTGVLTPLTNVGDDLPLYLEALGSLEVVEKILTFPVNVSKAITTFEDIETIYKDLGNAKQKLLDKAKEYEDLAAAEHDNLELKEDYEKIAADYRALSDKIVDIDNINFKLTGFSNGGLYFTYPTRVKWERVLGGKRGFKQLLEVAKENTDEDSNFGVYPDFDFQYVNNTSLFDGVGKRNTISRMVDNRYASKQVYSSVTGEFDTVYAMIVSADSLDRLYTKFLRKYDNYKATGISVSTLGSDLNSNFDEDNPVSRDDAQGYVTALLDRISNESKYSVMTSQGNIYAVKYVDHILGICTDSSYYRYSSYTIPFVGMILHGYVNYSGAALNYSGSPDYDLLRSLENGASIYYVIGYQNTDIMKDDEEFNKFYSVSYENWFDDIVEKYAIINEQLGGIQDYKIVNHEVLIGERVIDEKERVANLEALKNEYIAQFKLALETKIDEALESIDTTDYNKRIAVSADIDKLVSDAVERFEETELPESFKDALKAVLADFQKEYDVTGVDEANKVTVHVDALDYESEYRYVTGSTARDDDYETTDYTVDNDLIVMVTYANNEGKMKTFIINYNIYAVEVTIDLGFGLQTYQIGKYDFEPINH